MSATLTLTPVTLTGERLAPSREALRALLLAALGLGLPALVHMIPAGGVAFGPILMPLMIPVALAAFLLPLRSGLLLAAGLPLASWLTSGMPPMMPPVAPLLMLEGAVLVAAIHAAMALGQPWWRAMLAAIVLNRAVALVLGLGVAGLITGQPLAAAATAVALGSLGLLVALAVMPLLFRVFGRPRTGR